MQHDEKSPFFSELCTSYSSIRRTHTHTHTAGGDCRAPTGEKKKSGVVESLQVKKRSGPTFLTSFAFHPPAFVAWLSIWHLYCRRNLFSHFLFSPDFVFLLSVFFFIGFVAGEKGNVGSRSDRKHNGGCLCVCVLSRHFNDLMSSFGSTFNKVYGLEFSLLIIIVRCYSFRVEPPLAIRIITTTL